MTKNDLNMSNIGFIEKTNLILKVEIEPIVNSVFEFVRSFHFRENHDGIQDGRHEVLHSCVIFVYSQLLILKLHFRLYR